MAPEFKNLNHELTNLSKTDKMYFGARFIEIYSLLQHLTNINELESDNLKGPILDMGTGSGIATLALKKLSDTAKIICLDNDKEFHDPTNYYSGHYYIPDIRILDLSKAQFIREDISEISEAKLPQRFSLITSFYSEGWYTQYPNVLKQINKLLKPGGQFIFTTDWPVDAPKINWGESVSFRGNGGPESHTLILDTPEQVTNTKPKLFEQIGDYLEEKLRDSNYQKIGLIRDSNIHIFTKFN